MHSAVQSSHLSSPGPATPKPSTAGRQGRSSFVTRLMSCYRTTEVDSLVKGSDPASVWVSLLIQGEVRNSNNSLPIFPRTPVHRLTLRKRKSNSKRQDWFTAHQQNPVEPCAWQPADLRSPSIVCLIDYFPCNYSPCHTQYFTAPGKVQKGLSVLKGNIHIVTFESLMWSVRKHMLNWSPAQAISDA